MSKTLPRWKRPRIQADLERIQVFRDIEKCFTSQAQARVRTGIQVSTADQLKDVDWEIEDIGATR